MPKIERKQVLPNFSGACGKHYVCQDGFNFGHDASYVCNLPGHYMCDGKEHFKATCQNHFACEEGNRERAECGQHFACDGKKHETLECGHYACDTDEHLTNCVSG